VISTKGDTGTCVSLGRLVAGHLLGGSCLSPGHTHTGTQEAGAQWGTLSLNSGLAEGRRT
jgi:hypothetical protein